MAKELNVTASLKGAIGETLLTEHKSAIRDYFHEWCIDDLESQNPEWIPDIEHRVTFNVERPPHSYDVSIDGHFASWYPDALYTILFTPSPRSSKTFDQYKVEYPVEVKTGQSSELSDNQRAVMATIEQQSRPVFPLRVRVDVSDLPESFSVTPHRIQHSGETPLPEYTNDSNPSPPVETTKVTGSTSLAQFGADTDAPSNIPDYFEGLSEEMVNALNTASEKRTSPLTINEVLTATDQEMSEAEVRDALSSLMDMGVVCKPRKGTWKFI